MLLQWYTVPGATGYKVYRTDSVSQAGMPSHFKLVGNVIVSNVLDDTSYVDANSVKTGVKYFYYLTAFASDGSDSPPSDTANYTLLQRPYLIVPTNGGSVSVNSVGFAWVNSSAGYTVIRLEDISVLPASVVWVSHRFQTFAQYPSEPFNFDSTASEPLMSGHSYEWRIARFNIDGTGRPYEGSTSIWWKFTVK